MTQLSPEVVRTLDELQLRYIAALDDKSLDGWLGTFAQVDQASYVCISRENHDRGFPIALMLDDSYARLKDRVTFVTKVWRGTFQDYSTRHFVQRLGCEALEDGLFRIRSNFAIVYTPEQEAARPLTAGVYEDVVDVRSGTASFLSKRAVYDTNVLPQYVVYPF